MSGELAEGLMCLCGHDTYDHGRMVLIGALVDWACAQCPCAAMRPAHNAPSVVLVEPVPDAERLEPPQERNTA